LSVGLQEVEPVVRRRENVWATYHVPRVVLALAGFRPMVAERMPVDAARDELRRKRQREKEGKQDEEGLCVRVRASCVWR
jgi:hypothetical protein